MAALRVPRRIGRPRQRGELSPRIGTDRGRRGTQTPIPLLVRNPRAAPVRRFPHQRLAARAEVTLLVRTSSAGSTVETVAHWINVSTSEEGPAVECRTKYVWEANLEAAIKATAERSRP